MITYKRLIELFHYDPYTGIFYRKKLTSNFVKINSKVGTKNCYGYIQMYVDRKLYRAHRLAWLYVTGSWPTHEIDHINRIKSDNKFFNLREATRSQNAINIKSKNRELPTGVRKSGKKYQAIFIHKRKATHIGVFESSEEASIARKEFILKNHGDFLPITGV